MFAIDLRAAMAHVLPSWISAGANAVVGTVEFNLLQREGLGAGARLASVVAIGMRALKSPLLPRLDALERVANEAHVRRVNERGALALATPHDCGDGVNLQPPTKLVGRQQFGAL